MPALTEREYNGWEYLAYPSRVESKRLLTAKLKADEIDLVRMLRYCYAMPRKAITALMPDFTPTRLDHLVATGVLQQKYFDLPGGQQPVYMLSPDVMQAYGGAGFRHQKRLTSEDGSALAVAYCSPFAVAMRHYFDTVSPAECGLRLSKGLGTSLLMVYCPDSVTETMKILSEAKDNRDGRILMVFDHMLTMRQVMSKVFAQTALAEFNRVLFSSYTAGLDGAENHLYAVRQTIDGVEMQRSRLAAVMKEAMSI